jgi:uncharacterized protein (DUF924 family)
VITFWFGLPSEAWWHADPVLDEQVRERFGELWKQKRQLPPQPFLTDAKTALAAVVLFDQFPRNMFRGQAEQYATDQLALAVATGAIDSGLNDRLDERERGVLYMPFQHSERLEDQKRSMLLFTALGDEDMLGYAKKHYDVIKRFGRFPHRNAILRRAPRQAEVDAGEVVPW